MLYTLHTAHCTLVYTRTFAACLRIFGDATPRAAIWVSDRVYARVQAVRMALLSCAALAARMPRTEYQRSTPYGPRAEHGAANRGTSPARWRHVFGGGRPGVDAVQP